MPTELEETIAVEQDDIHCANCKGNTWKAIFEEDSEGRRYLLLCCANEECVREQQKLLGGSEDDLVVSFQLYLGDDSETDEIGTLEETLPN